MCSSLQLVAVGAVGVGPRHFARLPRHPAGLTGIPCGSTAPCCTYFVTTTSETPTEFAVGRIGLAKPRMFQSVCLDSYCIDQYDQCVAALNIMTWHILNQPMTLDAATRRRRQFETRRPLIQLAKEPRIGLILLPNMNLVSRLGGLKGRIPSPATSMWYAH